MFAGLYCCGLLRSARTNVGVPVEIERSPRRNTECRRKGLIGRVLDVSSQRRYGGAKMDYLGALRMFVRAVEVGSFSKAAIATNTKTSTVSRAIASLEEDLGVSLFHRTTRRANLTEPGATFCEHARGVLRGLDEARDAASAMQVLPNRWIRLHGWTAPGRWRSRRVPGWGVVLMPEWLVGDDIKAGRLRQVFREWSYMIVTKQSGIFGVFPPHRMVPPKVRAFLDFAQKRFGKPPYWDPDWTEDRHKTSRDVSE